MQDHQTTYYIAQLVFKHLRGDLHPHEKLDLENWLSEKEENRQLFERMIEDVNIKRELRHYLHIDKNAARRRLSEKMGLAQRPKLFPLWKKFAAAVAVILITTLGVLLFKNRVNTDQLEKQEQAGLDLMPAENSATLILNDGRKIALDEAKEGKIIDQGGVAIFKSPSGEIEYNFSDDNSMPQNLKANSLVHHTLKTGRGQKSKITLSDGTKVWLNAASELKFPVNFASDVNREVSLSGEGYFEVAKDTKHPFVVRSGRQKVRVLGTHFNINSYKDESKWITTLFEGAVEVTAEGEAPKKLNPGQQATLIGQDVSIEPADLTSASAWRDGLFVLKNEDLGSLMRKISKWYDVDVAYDAEIAEEAFYGSISRTKSLQSVLKALEISGNVKFRLEGRRLTVMKK